MQPVPSEQVAVQQEIILVEVRELTIEQMIASYDWNFDTAYNIAKCESNLNPNAINDNPSTKDYSVGIFQINLYGPLATSRPSEAWLRDAANNVEYAYELYTTQGWGAWKNCYRMIQ